METAALYNLSDNTFVPFHITESPLCSGHLLTTDGKAIIAGGEPPCIQCPKYICVPLFLCLHLVVYGLVYGPELCINVCAR